MNDTSWVVPGYVVSEFEHDAGRDGSENAVYCARSFHSDE